MALKEVQASQPIPKLVKNTHLALEIMRRGHRLVDSGGCVYRWNGRMVMRLDPTTGKEKRLGGGVAIGLAPVLKRGLTVKMELEPPATTMEEQREAERPSGLNGVTGSPEQAEDRAKDDPREHRSPRSEEFQVFTPNPFLLHPHMDRDSRFGALAMTAADAETVHIANAILGNRPIGSMHPRRTEIRAKVDEARALLRAALDLLWKDV